MEPFYVAMILQVFLIGLVAKGGMQRLAPGQWMPMGVAVMGMAFAGALLV